MTRRMRLATTVLASLLVVALGAGASSAAPAGRAASHGTATPSIAQGRNEVPWSSIGQGWILAKWVPHPRARHPYAFLEVVSPSGARYVLYRISLFDQLVDWSGDGQRALLMRMNQDGTSTLRTLEVRTGALLGSFRVRGYTAGGFSRPAGLALFVSTIVLGHSRPLTRYSFDGAVQRSFPEGIGGLGQWNNSWAMSPRGTLLAAGYDRGLAVLGNDGSLVERLPAPGVRSCAPVRWWTATVILARCVSGHVGMYHLFLFSPSWAGPRALTRYPRIPDYGDLDAWRVGSSVYVQASSGCGPGWVAQLHGVVPVQVTIPPFGPSSDGDTILGATSTALAIESMSCIGVASVAWWTPSTNSVHQVIGPPVSPGTVDQALTYPSPAS